MGSSIEIGWFMKSVLMALFILILFALPAFAADVKNELVRQEGNRVVFSFDVAGQEAETDVEITLTINGKTYKAKDLHLEGDYGKVKPASGKRIYWNVLQDFPWGYTGNLDWEIKAGGGGTIEGMVFVKGGCFEMGCGNWTSDCYDDEKPVHEVCVEDFYMGRYEVTVGEFRKFVNETSYKTDAEKEGGCYVWTGSEWSKKNGTSWGNPGFAPTERDPVVCVSWNDANQYFKWLNKGSSTSKYRLPTEEEWEYAARSGGKKVKYAWGNGDPYINGRKAANIADEFSKKKFNWSPIWEGYDDGYAYTAPVGSFAPNELGLYDMTGNVWEWCSDWYGEDYYGKSPKHNPKGPGSGSDRVLRGGSWGDNPRSVRASGRNGGDPGGRDNGSGFRCSRTQ